MRCSIPLSQDLLHQTGLICAETLMSVIILQQPGVWSTLFIKAKPRGHWSDAIPNNICTPFLVHCMKKTHFILS